MKDWNTVISVHEHGFRKAVDLFGQFGEVSRTEFFNVLTVRARDVQGMLETLRERTHKSPESLAFLARLVPVSHTFTFHSAEEFEAEAKKIVLEWTPRLAEKSFHVRIRRRGFKGKITSPDEERFLDTAVLGALRRNGRNAKIKFDDPDAVIAVETVGTRAGLSLWVREDLAKYPFVRI